jgi:glycosyltransferase involved in cell wall biosynthesis
MEKTMQVTIDGVPYVKQDDKPTVSIGVGITTHNRQALAASTLAKIQAATPGARIVVVDDASQPRVRIPGAEVYRFDKNVGIARAKNKCLELLADCDHIFLFDDDTYPLAPGWTEPYVTSPEHHLMYLFEAWASGTPVGDDAVIYKDASHRAHVHARGCMLYVDRLVLDTVGGMDVRFGMAMNEHLDWSMRIHNAGLTTFRYMDVLGSEQLIYSMDQHQEVRTSIDNRRQQNEGSQHLLEAAQTSREYMPYGKDVVIACYFANVMDVQRGKAWLPDQRAIRKLQASVEAQGLEFVLIHNCFDLPNRVDISSSPYFERWLKEWQYLRNRKDIVNVFVVDATDVDMINNPFPHIERGKLYVGDEPGNTVAIPWMLTRHQEPNVNAWLRENSTLPLLNCGVVGGRRQLVMDLCRDMYLYHFEYPQDQTEMGIFNRLMYTRYDGVIEYGRHVTSLFKKFEERPTSWWRHK